MKYMLILLLFLIALTSNSQKQLQPIFCGNEIFSDILRTHYPAFNDDIKATFANVRSMTSPRSDEPLTIKVVVHVVWNSPEENLHDSIILNQIQVLNEDYNRLNADTFNLRSIFLDEASSTNIHFELAEIIRMETDQLFEVDLLGTNLLTEAKYDEQGGSDAVDPLRYLNIWIVHIQPIEIFGIPVGQILGFAFPPAGLDNWPKGVSAPTPAEDGVVLDYRIVGRNNPNTIEIPGTGGLLTVKGRSATHEVGHYLGLRHIWGDGGLLGPNDCLQSDGIDDTPFADAQSAFDCDKTKNSCPQVEAHYNENMPDLIENFMDYAAEDCMNMFTNGQANHMRNVLLGPRQGLLEDVSAVVHPKADFSLLLYPNPSSGEVTLTWNGEDFVRASISIIDHTGRIVKRFPLSERISGMHFNISTGPLPQGLYQVVVQADDFVVAKRLIIQ
jgi:hypothetical protein